MNINSVEIMITITAYAVEILKNVTAYAGEFS
jgi:hypothetical protein